MGNARWFVVLALFAAQDREKEPAFTWKPDPGHIVVAGHDGGPREASERVITDAKTWEGFKKECSGDAARFLKGARVDFEKERVLVVCLGADDSLLTQGERELAGVRGIVEEKDKMTVHYTHCSSDKASTEPAYPVFVVKAPRSDKKTEFKKRIRCFGA